MGADHGGAAVVHQDDVVFLGAVSVRGAAGAGGEGGVDRHVLAGGGAGEDAEQSEGVLDSGDDFLDAGDHDVHARQGLREIAVALVSDDDAAAGFGDEEVGAGDADVRGEEFFAEFAACLSEEVAAFAEDAVRWQVGVGFAETFLPILAVEVEGGGDDVAGGLAAQLQDVFAEVGLDRGDAVGFQEGVEGDFLGDHGFSFGHGFGAGVLADF